MLPLHHPVDTAHRIAMLDHMARGRFYWGIGVRSLPTDLQLYGIEYSTMDDVREQGKEALCCYDEAYTIPTPKAQRISLRTMQLLIEEMGLTDTVDPLGGSYYVETLTNQMEQKIVEVMQWVDTRGGIVKAVADGIIQKRVSEYAYQRQRALETGALRKVGVNCYTESEEENPNVELHPYDELGAMEQIESLRRVKAERDNDGVERALSALRADAAAGRNVMPALMQAVKSYASVGEMTKALVEVYGRFKEPTQLWRMVA